MKKTITLSILLVLLLVFQRASAQEREITGKVTSKDDNKPIPGVTVVVKGTTLGSATDLEGNYDIKGVPADSKILVFSAVGLKTREVDLGSSNSIDVVMEVDVLKLNEVVVTALGITQEKKALSYATQTVGGDELNQSGTGNPLEELSGKVSGLNVISNSGDPGAGTYINLRGPRLLTGDNQPLIVVDGVPIDNSINSYDPTNGGNPSSGPNADVLGGISPDNRGIDINPNDIESITVLKGPAATALYGIQAASGAIIITTKRGGGLNKGPAVTFSSSTGWSSANKLPSLQNTYAQGSDGVYEGPTSGSRYSWGPPISNLAWSHTYNGQQVSGTNPDPWDSHGDIVAAGTPGSTPITPYNAENFFVTGSVLNNNIAVSGGNANSGYRMSIGNVKETGIIPLTGYIKTNLNLSAQTNLTKKLSASFSINYINSSRDIAQQGSNASGVMLGLLRTAPTFDNTNGISPNDAYNNPLSYVMADGTPRNYRGGLFGYDNPYWSINRNPSHEDLDRVFGMVQADYKLYDWMTLTYRLGGDVYAQSLKSAYDIYSDEFYEGGSQGGAIFLNDWANRQYNSDFIINMNKRFNSDWTGNLILGQNYFTVYSSNRFQEGTGFAIPDWFDLGNATSYFSQESEATIHRMAEYAQAQVGWREQLYLTVTGRNEISSTLPSNNDVYFYPSASVGWVFTEPLGLASNKIFNYGKLRLSYADVGKDAPAQALITPYKPTFINNGFTSSGIQFPLSGVAGYANTSVFDVYGDPTLKPYSTSSEEGGFDLSFLQNRISLDATYYHDKTTNEIFTVPISYTTGNAAAVLNAGDMTNKGIEITLKTTPVKTKSGIQWDLIFNWSHNDNLVDQLYNGVQNLLLSGFSNGGIYAVQGMPYGEIYGTAYVRTSYNAQTGTNSTLGTPMIINDQKYEADGITPNPGYGMPTVTQGTQPLGSIQPKWLGSVLSNLSFKGITLGFQIDIRQGGYIWNGTESALDFIGTSGATANRGSTTVFNGVLGHLNSAGQLVHYNETGAEVTGAGSANNILATENQYYWQSIVGSNGGGATEATVEDGSYIKLRTVSLTYALPKAWVTRARFNSFSIGIFASNIILHTKYTGVDPETSLVGPSNGQGLDYFNNPGIKVIGFKVTAGL